MKPALLPRKKRKKVRGRLKVNELYKDTKDLPNCAQKTTESKLQVKEELILEGMFGPFDCLFDYTSCQETIEGLKRATLMHYWPKGIEFHSRHDKQIKQAFDNLTLLANADPEELDPDNPLVGALYAANFTLGYRPVFQEAIKELETESFEEEKITLISPLRGGRVVQVISKALGYDLNIPQIRASRVVLKDGSYLIGIQLLDESELTNRIIFGDDCRAVGGSEDALLRLLLRENPAIRAIASAVGVGVKSASSLLAAVWGQKEGISHRSHVGAPANAMTDEYYLKVAPGEIAAGVFPRNCLYRVGDMGRFMDLEGERGEKIIPVIQAVAQGQIPAELIFEVTEQVIADPRTLSSKITRIFEEIE